MASPQNPSATPTFPATITPPANGDPLDAQQLNLDVETPLQNGVEAARLLLYGGGIRRRVNCVSNTVLTLQPLGAVAVTTGGIWTTYKHLTPSTVSPAVISGGLLASTRYWVYAYSNAGSLDFIAVTISPDTGLKYQNGNTDFIYVSTFVTDASSNVLPYTQTDSKYTYLEVTGTEILVAGNATAATPVPFGTLVPVGAGNATIRAAWSSTVVTFVQIQTSSGASGIFTFETTSTGNVSTSYVLASTGTGNQVQYRVGNVAATLNLTIAGFEY